MPYWSVFGRSYRPKSSDVVDIGGLCGAGTPLTIQFCKVASAASSTSNSGMLLAWLMPSSGVPVPAIGVPDMQAGTGVVGSSRAIVSISYVAS